MCFLICFSSFDVCFFDVFPCLAYCFDLCVHVFRSVSCLFALCCVLHFMNSFLLVGFSGSNLSFTFKCVSASFTFFVSFFLFLLLLLISLLFSLIMSFLFFCIFLKKIQGRRWVHVRRITQNVAVMDNQPGERHCGPPGGEDHTRGGAVRSHTSRRGRVENEQAKKRRYQSPVQGAAHKRNTLEARRGHVTMSAADQPLDHGAVQAALVSGWKSRNLVAVKRRARERRIAAVVPRTADDLWACQRATELAPSLQPPACFHFCSGCPCHGSLTDLKKRRARPCNGSR